MHKVDVVGNLLDQKSCGNSHDVATVVNKMLTSKTCTNRIVEFLGLSSSKLSKKACCV